MAAKYISVQAVDTNGNPYSGAKLYVYDAGTSTPRAIYTESGLGTASANPAIADANGTTVVWVDDAGGDIKIQLTNSAGTVTAHNQDNIPIGSLTCYPIVTFQGDQSLLTTSSPTFADMTLGAVPFSGMLADPGADRLAFWDDSASQMAFMSLGTGLAFNDAVLELDGDLQDISGLTPTDGGVIIGDGTDFVVETGDTLRTSLGLAIGSDVLAYDANLQAFVDAFTAPTTDGTAGQYLKTDGAGALSFATPAGAGDTLAAANETISGDWNFTGSPALDGSALVSQAASQTLTNKTLTSPVLNGSLSGTAVLDEDDFASDSATKVPTQQSVKAYSDGQRISSVAALQALSAGVYSSVLLEDTARGGVFVWKAGDQSASITADPYKILWVPPASDATGASGAWQRQRHNNDVHYGWAPLNADGATDDAAVIQSMIDLVGNGGSVWLDEKVYAVASTLNLGDGSATANVATVSTVNNVSLRGVRGQFLRLQVQALGDDEGTVLKWTGAAGGRMLDVNGPCVGNGTVDIAFDCNDTADAGVRLRSASYFTWDGLAVANFRATGLELNVQQATSISGGHDVAQISSVENVFVTPVINGYGLSRHANVGLLMDGYATADLDPVRNTFIAPTFYVPLDGGTGIELNFCDENDFIGVKMFSAGTANGSQASIRLVGVTANSTQYPVNNSFTGQCQFGQNLPVVVDTTSAEPGLNHGLAMTQSSDQEKVPEWPATKFFHGNRPDAQVSGKIERVSNYGLARIRDDFRNKFRNGQFHVAQRGTSVTLSSGAYTLDGWVFVFDGTVTATFSQQEFTPGQTDVPFEPKYFGRLSVTAASGSSFFLMGQRVEGVRTLEGRYANVSAFMKASTTLSGMVARYDQTFGTGGSPSATVAAETSDSHDIGTSWSRYRWNFETLPSVSGKTLGTNDDDNLAIWFKLPINTTFTLDIAFAQFEEGLADTPPELRPLPVDEVLCQRYFNTVPDGGNRFAVGQVMDANTASFDYRFPVALRPGVPGLTTSGTAADYSIAGAACSSVPAISYADSNKVQVDFTKTTHGLTVGQSAVMEHNGSGYLWFSREL